MALPTDINPFVQFAGAGGDLGALIDQSLRFQSQNSTQLTKTLGTATDRDRWTFSVWVKKVKFDEAARQVLLSGYGASNDNDWCDVGYENDNGLYYTTNGYTANTNSIAKYRDPAAWQHVVVTWDGSNMKFYSNGRRVINDTQVSGNLGINGPFTHTIGNTGNGTQRINCYMAEMNFLDGILIGETLSSGDYIIDDFGRYNIDGVWVPKNYAGSYNTNGFHLTFDSTQANGIGHDSSGSGNHFTASGFETTPISSANRLNDIDIKDTPTSNYALFNPLWPQTRPSLKGGNMVLNTANDITGQATFRFPVGTTGKYWVEAGTANLGATTNAPALCITDQLDAAGLSNTAWSTTANYSSIGGYQASYSNFTSTSATSYTTVGGQVGMAIDFDAQEVKMYNNSSLINTDATVDFTKELAIVVMQPTSSYNTYEPYLNAGQQDFIQTVPTGFKELQTNNLPEPTIKNGKEHFDVVTFTNSTSGNTITGLNFQPDFVWIKVRNQAYSHRLHDSIRGVQNYLISNANSVEQTSQSDSLLSFTSDGFTTGSLGQANGDTNVAWCWKAGGTASVTYTVKVVSDSGNKYRFDDFGTSAVTLDLEEGGTYVFDQSDSSNSGHPLRFSTTSDGTHGGGSEYTTGVTTTGTPGSAGAKTTITVASGAATLHYYCSVHSGMGGQANTNDTKGSSNFAGTIQSKLTANTDAGFSIITWTGTGADGSYGHGLDKAPEFIIHKRRNSTSDWHVYHEGIGGSPTNDVIYLNLDDAANTGNNSVFRQDPDANVIYTGSAGSHNTLNATYVDYAWHSVEGFSKFGSYTGNANGTTPDADGPFVYLGFKPAFILIKRHDSNFGGEWSMYDTTRSPGNPNRSLLLADLNNSETTSGGVDFLSNGFKIRDGGGFTNQSGGSYIYAAFAENPNGGENAPPATAR